MKKLVVIVVAVVALWITYSLTFGATGLSKRLDTGHGMEKYKASLNDAIKDMDKKQIAAFDWAVEGYDLENLHKNFPNYSPKKIIRSEVKRILKEYPAQIADLEKLKPKYDPLLADLKKITASSTTFRVDSDTFGSQPMITAIVTNGSTLNISSMEWEAELYIDGNETPVARTVLFDSYYKTASLFRSDDHDATSAGGLYSAATKQREFKVGFVRGDAKWTTLEIQNAKQRLVKLTVIPESVKDFGNRKFLAGAPYEGIDSRNAAIAAAKEYSLI